MSRVERVLLALLPVVFVGGVLAPGAAVEPAGSEVIFAFEDDEIVESSGLVARDGLVVTVNDSGDSNRVFAVDPATGGTVGVTGWQGDAFDIEALAPGPDGTVLVGDIGDNAAVRDEVVVSEVSAGAGDRDVDATQWRFAYSDGPHDAETLLVHPVTGRIYVVAKEFIGRIYQAPVEPDPDDVGVLSPLDGAGAEGVLGIATDGAFFPDGRHLILRNYGQAAVYTWPGLDRLGTFDLPAQQQGEGIAVSEDGEVLVSSEGEHAEVLRVALPEDVEAAMVEGAAGSSSGSSSVPEVVAPDDTVAADSEDRGWWPWALGALAGLVVVLVLLRSLRPR